VTDNRPTVELAGPIAVQTTERPTMELEPVVNLATHRYSVRRAATADERSQLVERVSVRQVAPHVPKPQWKLELSERTATIRNGEHSIEMPIEDARRIAEAILRGR
jgi:hypothetical protein